MMRSNERFYHFKDNCDTLVIRNVIESFETLFCDIENVIVKDVVCDLKKDVVMKKLFYKTKK